RDIVTATDKSRLGWSVSSGRRRRKAIGSIPLPAASIPHLVCGFAQELFSGYEDRFDVDRHVFEFVQHSLYFRADNAETSLHLFRFIVIAFGLDRHDIACE